MRKTDGTWQKEELNERQDQQREKLKKRPAKSFCHEQVGHLKFPVHLGCAHNFRLIIFFLIVLEDMFAFGD